MKNIKSHFVFTKQQRSGIFVLLLLIVGLQCIYFFVDFKTDKSLNTVDETQIAIFQKEVDSLALLRKNKKYEIHPYNPNFISDYKGYVLGMSAQEIDRLHAFRKNNKYVNSAKAFQQVTKVSDSLLRVLSPKFKFPDWVTQQKSSYKKYSTAYQKELNKTTAKDILKQTAINYKVCYRIINFRDDLGGFQNFNQLQDVYQITDDDIEKIKGKFRLKIIPNIQKINLNLATVAELSKNAYINEYLASNIVEERTLRDGFSKISELKFVKNFPSDKYERIQIYFTVN